MRLSSRHETSMEHLTDPTTLRETAQAWRSQGLRTALVPTMGFLHAGHLSLMKYARSQADRVMISIFVNPTQFGPGEDLANYPRDLERDLRLAEEAGVDLVFTPEPEAMYPPGDRTRVEVVGMDAHLCGARRPGHFKGVATVVAKLLLLTLPHLAIFGEKDWQQLAILKRMALDLRLPTTILGRPTVREPDGLAMSSRNVYLTPIERAQAPNVRAALLRGQELLDSGERDVERLLALVRDDILANVPAGRLEYLELVDPDDLEPVSEWPEQALLAAAIQLGKARLIDNLLLTTAGGR